MQTLQRENIVSRSNELFSMDIDANKIDSHKAKYVNMNWYTHHALLPNNIKQKVLPKTINYERKLKVFFQIGRRN